MELKNTNEYDWFFRITSVPLVANFGNLCFLYGFSFSSMVSPIISMYSKEAPAYWYVFLSMNDFQVLVLFVWSTFSIFINKNPKSRCRKPWIFWILTLSKMKFKVGFYGLEEAWQMLQMVYFTSPLIILRSFFCKHGSFFLKHCLYYRCTFTLG